LFLLGSISVYARTEVCMHIVLKVNFFHPCFTSHLRTVMTVFLFRRDNKLFRNGAVCISGIRTHSPSHCTLSISELQMFLRGVLTLLIHLTVLSAMTWVNEFPESKLH
jgi:hypothetical protein